MVDIRAVIFTEIFKQVLDVVKQPDVPVKNDRDAEVVAKKVTEVIAPTVINQNNIEPLWKSRVMRGALLALVGLVGGYFGLSISDADIEMGLSAISDIVVAIGILYSIYGRLTSKGAPKI